MSVYAIVALVVLVLFIPIASFFLGVFAGEINGDAGLALSVLIMGTAITLGHLVYIL